MGASLAYDRVAHVEPLLVDAARPRGRPRAALATRARRRRARARRARRSWAAELDVTAERLARADRRATTALAAAIALEEELVALYQHALPGAAGREDRDDRGDDPRVALPAPAHPSAPD